ncbi:MAG: peptidylprolyl isomerase [Planctomycetes bacterium]|nr:peptidylprolyl isomerase [Planctomycetota bacterium]
MPIDVDKADLSKVRAHIDTPQGTMTLVFFADKAPETIKNFVKLADKGFYNNLAFHRIIREFMIQGGCPKGDGTGDAGYKLKAEFNDTHHGKGVISMARAQDPNSAGCQFFICHGDAGFLDRQYTAFGRIEPSDAASMAALEKIANAKVGRGAGGEMSKPVERMAITTIRIEVLA